MEGKYPIWAAELQMEKLYVGLKIRTTIGYHQRSAVEKRVPKEFSLRSVWARYKKKSKKKRLTSSRWILSLGSIQHMVHFKTLYENTGLFLKTFRFWRIYYPHSLIFRRAPTIRKFLAPSRLKQHKKQTTKSLNRKGSYKCGASRCHCCKEITDKRTEFQSSKLGEYFYIKHHFSCQSRYVIYLLECSCGLQYVGWTIQKLQARMNKHRSNSKKKVSCSTVYLGMCSCVIKKKVTHTPSLQSTMSFWVSQIALKYKKKKENVLDLPTMYFTSWWAQLNNENINMN